MSQSFRVAALAIGDELLDGKLVDRNIARAVASCTAHGALVIETRIVRDDLRSVSRALTELAAIADVVVTSGGLGPTTDDRTRAAFAEAVGAPLTRRAHAVARLRGKMDRRGRALTDTQLRQADFPGPALLLENDWGTADAFEVTIGGARVFALPGVPREFDALFARDVIPACASAVEERTRRWAVVGIGEADIAQRIEARPLPLRHTVRYLADTPLVRIELASRDEIDAEAAAAIEEAVATWRLAAPHTTLAESVLAQFSLAGSTLGAIESCTGGLIAHLATEVNGASATWLGGVVAYTAALKQELVGVSEATLSHFGTIHPRTSAALAERGRRRLGVDLCIGVTGVAGPGPSEGQTAGTVFVAVASAEETVIAHASFPGLSRADVKQQTAALALRLAALTLTHDLDLANAYFGVTQIERLAPGCPS